MDSIKAIITDDEQAARNVLSQLLRLECPTVEIIAKCNDVPSTVEEIKKQQPDVVFLDIQMPEYVGYEIVNFFDEINFEIIFVTAYDQYAIKAFELNALDYLVKPINRHRLVQVVEKLHQKVENRKNIERYQLLKQSLQQKTLDHIIISELGKQTIIKFIDIVAIEANGSYSRIYLYGKKHLTVTKNIKQFEKLLPADGSFLRTHKSWMINKTHIQSYIKSDGIILLSSKLQAKLSKQKKAEFETAINLK